MTKLLTADWFREHRDTIEADEQFRAAMRYFDGSMLFQGPDTTTWLKVYRGDVIEVLDHEPPLGSTFRLSADRAAWERLFTDASRNPFGEQLTVDKVTIAGSTLEATRAIDGLNAMIDAIRAETATDADSGGDRR